MSGAGGGAAVAAAQGGDAQAGVAAASPADAAIAISVPPGLDGYPALAAAVQARNDAHRQAFDAALAGARRSGVDPSAWRLRIDWRGIAGNRYLRLMQGDGGVDTGSAAPVPITERVTYEGIGKQVLALGDWFTDDAAAAAAVGELVAADAPEAAGTVDLSTVTYEPVFSADGPVMGFDLLLAPAAGAGEASTRRVRVPLAAVDTLIDPAQRQALSAEAAGL